MMKLKSRFFQVFVLACFPLIGWAAHPLITDDTGTQGKGNTQIELNAEYGHEDEDGVVENGVEFAPTLSYGIGEVLDVVLGIPYVWFEVEEDDEKCREDGIGDASLEIKWRFYEAKGWSFAIKPGISIPTGDDDKGLGTGEMGYSAFFITTKEIEPWVFHLNAGYMRNENNAEERLDLWHISLASEFQVIENLKAVANIGSERNADPTSDKHPIFALGGLIYSLSENWDLDAGIKMGLNKPETDYTVLAGTAFRF